MCAARPTKGYLFCFNGYQCIDAYVMVEITDCTDENSQQSSSSSRSQPSVSLLCLLASCTTKIKVYLKSRGIDSILWILRIITIVFGVLFVISSGKEKPSYYEKTLLSAAATNALRLQQRIGRVQFNMGFIRRLFAEDASHYLLFSLTLLTVYPITFGIAPSIGFSHLKVSHFLENFLQKYMQTLLHISAYCEILLLPRKVPANYSVYSLPVFGYAVFFLSKPTYKKLSVTFSSSNFEDYSSIAAYILKYGALNYIHFNVLNCFMISDIRLIDSFSYCASTEHI
ncbi:putative protein Kr-h2 [Trichinella spiralis]|uniref:putative protein Kr-h2 n=1 Tax=Trichinella spiralis TaxID=6334 RepID=UPI0001EFC0A7|nr:putative protein Kr-h2 [Trichinella spiralis]